MHTIAAIKRFLIKMESDHLSAYAAQSAYFVMLSSFPFFMMLFTLIQYTPLTKSDLLRTAVDIMPSNIDPLIISIIDEVYSKSSAIVSVTALLAAWTAGKGVLAITKALNSVYDTLETRTYVILRFRAAVTMVGFVVAIVLSLVFIVFGNKLFVFIAKQYPLFSDVTKVLNEMKVVFVLAFLVVLFWIMYRYLPDKKVPLFHQLPGAILAAVGWIAFSYGFSIYFDYSSGFSNMYGSLTTLIIVMLWLYSLMYIMLLGAEVNVIFGGSILKKVRRNQK